MNLATTDIYYKKHWPTTKELERRDALCHQYHPASCYWHKKEQWKKRYSCYKCPYDPLHKEGMDDDAIKKKISWCLTHQGASSQTLHKVDGIFSATYPKIGGHCHQSRLHLHTVMGKLNEIENTSLLSWRTVTGRVILVHFPIIWFS